MFELVELIEGGSASPPLLHLPHREINHKVKKPLPHKLRHPPRLLLRHRLCHGDDELGVVDSPVLSLVAETSSPP